METDLTILNNAIDTFNNSLVMVVVFDNVRDLLLFFVWQVSEGHGELFFCMVLQELGSHIWRRLWPLKLNQPFSGEF